MKLIHTSDWHLGQEFYSYERSQEHASFLNQLKQIVSEECPDALLISGDIFHNATPSNAVMRMFTDYLDAIRRACPTMQIVVIAGNHDSSSRLEINRTLWKHLGVFIIGKIENNQDGVDLDQHIIPITTSENCICGYVVTLPFVPSQAFPDLTGSTPRDERQAVFMQSLADRVNQTNTEALPVVMMAHMAIEGSDITGHDTIQGGMDYLPIAELKVDYDYLALGHIHCPQQISVDAHRLACARYCGSPIAVNFEEKYVHSVTVAEIQSKGTEPLIRTIPIQNPWPLKTIPKEPLLFDEALKELESFPDEEQAYIRLYVRLTDVAPHNAMERANNAVANKKCRFCCFKWAKEEHNAKKQLSFSDVDHMKAQSPLDIATLYYENKYGQPLDDNLKAMLTEVIDEVSKN